MANHAKVAVCLEFGSEKQLTTLLDALAPETKASTARRAQVKLEKNGLSLMLTVEADDTVALRSTLNAYLRWINSTVKIMSLVGRPDFCF